MSEPTDAGKPIDVGAPEVAAGGAPAAAAAARPGLGHGVAIMLVDWLAVLVFIFGGLESHDGQQTLGNLLLTAWPFLVARMVALPLIRGRAEVLWPAGVIAWLVTWALGLGVRTLVGGGTALPFVLVALGMLGALLVGWRLLAAVVRWQVRRNAALDQRPVR